jgi:hypothetical protein
MRIRELRVAGDALADFASPTDEARRRGCDADVGDFRDS